MLDLDELMRLAEAATEGPWAYSAYGDENLCGVGCALGDDGKTPMRGQIGPDGYSVSEPVAPEVLGQANAAFIAASREAVPALVERVRELEGQVERRAEERDYMAGQFNHLHAQHVERAREFAEERAKQIDAYVAGAQKLRDANTALMNECLHYRARLSDIANGEGIYGAQAYEYKQLARRALAYKPGDPHPHNPAKKGGA